MENGILDGMKQYEPRELAEKIVSILDQHKAGSIRMLHTTEKTVLADYFIICAGQTNTQTRGLADELEFKLGQEEIYPAHVEGQESATWILLDFGTVIVHIFNAETRRFYNLEKLWSEAEEVDLSGLLTED